MIPNWLSFYSKKMKKMKKKVLTDEQKAILRALADPVYQDPIENDKKFLYDSWRYKKEDKERIKIWPTAVKVEMPKMITKQRDVVHRVLIKDIVKRNESSYYMFADSLIEGRLAIAGEASVFLI